MPDIALIGPDGAGKSTVTKALLQSSRLPLKYIYMGTAIESSNLMLPTSRLVKSLKEGNSSSRRLMVRLKMGPLRHLWRAARLFNQLAEECFRQSLSWFYQLRGNLVLYDRHFLIDYSLAHIQQQDIFKKLHRWLLEHLFPRPNLVIFLDAPGEVLYARKREKTPEDLEARRQSYLQLQPYFRNWVNIDATQPLPKVIRQAELEITEYLVVSGYEGLLEKESQESGNN